MTAIQSIEAFRRFCDIPIATLCARAGVTESTYRLRLACPDDLTVGEMKALFRALRISKERKQEILQTI